MEAANVLPNSTLTVQDWRKREIRVARSAKSGVVATVDPFENLVRTGISPWPPPEIVQKLYQSRQARAFKGDELACATKVLGFYSDLQSVHSEDAITWSVFGPLVYAPQEVRVRFVSQLLEKMGVSGAITSDANVWLWRRVPHPDTLVSGGPEVDFGIQTNDVFLLGEAKWRSKVGTRQGKLRDKDQVTLRREFCHYYGKRLLPKCRHFIVLGVSRKGGLVPVGDTDVDGVAIHTRDLSWEDLSTIEGHPLSQEVRAYIAWKRQHSHAG